MHTYLPSQLGLVVTMVSLVTAASASDQCEEASSVFAAASARVAKQCAATERFDRYVTTPNTTDPDSAEHSCECWTVKVERSRTSS